MNGGDNSTPFCFSGDVVAISSRATNYHIGYCCCLEHEGYDIPYCLVLKQVKNLIAAGGVFPKTVIL